MVNSEYKFSHQYFRSVMNGECNVFDSPLTTHHSRFRVFFHAFSGKIANHGADHTAQQNNDPTAFRRKIDNGKTKNSKKNGPDDAAFYPLAGGDSGRLLKRVPVTMAALWHKKSLFAEFKKLPPENL